MSEKLYLMPGCSVGKQGLPGGKLEAKKDGKPLLIEEKYKKVLEKNIPYLKTTGSIKTADELEDKKETRGRKKKESESAPEPEKTGDED